MTVVIVNYEAGNVGSVLRALHAVGAEGTVVDEPEALYDAERIILPGVGNFSDAMERLAAGGWVPKLLAAVRERRRPLLGICVGMQLLAEAGTESSGPSGPTPGLGLVAGIVRRLDALGCRERIPQQGWNALVVREPVHPLLRQIPSGTDFYFSNSFALPADAPAVAATVEYGVPFAAAVASGHVMGIQFHPEKSSRAGLRVLRNFLEFPVLKVRVIPTLLWKGVGLVKGVGFDSWRRVGPVLPAVKVYNTRDVDELILVDITANTGTQAPDVESIADFADECFVPFTVGGGVRELLHVQQLLRAGADKVCINTAAYEKTALITEAARRFGAQCVVVSIDTRRSGSAWQCYSHSGTRLQPPDPVTWAREVVDRGAGEILITSIDRDGTMQGYDLALVEAVARAVPVPVIASGGAGSYEHMRQAVQEAGASAVAAASMFHFTEQTPAAAKQALAAAGIAVRSTYVAPV